jgi:hypothetical protein
MPRQSVLDTRDISYGPMKNANESAAKLLQIFSLLSSDGIPGKILQPSVLSRIGASTEAEINDALSLLCSLAFVNVSGEDDQRLYQVHRLVILWARTKLTDRAEESIFANAAFDILLDSFTRSNLNSVHSRAEGAIIFPHALAIEILLQSSQLAG